MTKGTDKAPTLMPMADKYVGEFKDGKRNGQGTYTYANGNKYVGEFKDDKRNGQGTFTYANGDKYVGEFKDDKRNGQGTFTYDNGQKYVGFWKNNLKHGEAVFITADGNQTKQTWVTGFLQKTCSDDPTACTTVADLCEKASYYTEWHQNGNCCARSQHVKSYSDRKRKQRLPLCDGGKKTELKLYRR